MMITIGLIILALPVIAMAYCFLDSSSQKLEKSAGKDDGAFVPESLVYLNEQHWEGAEAANEPEERRVATR